MLPHPCPCTTLQRGVKAIAILSAVFDLLNILIITAILGGVDASDNFLFEDLQDTHTSILIVLLILNIILLGLDIVLYLGAQKRNTTMCWAWLGFMSLVFLFELISSIPKLSDVVVLVAQICVIAICIYLLYVVYAFIMEIRNQPDPQLNPAYQVSTMVQPQGSVYRAMGAGTYYTAAQPIYPMGSQPLNQPQPAQPTSAPSL